MAKGKDMRTGEAERNSEEKTRKEDVGTCASLTSGNPRHPESSVRKLN